MTNKYQIICISGSMKFFNEMLTIASELTLLNKIVIMPFSLKSGLTEKQKQDLDLLHLSKISMSDILYVVNIKNYIGESTMNEINHALENNIPIVYHENEIDD